MDEVTVAQAREGPPNMAFQIGHTAITKAIIAVARLGFLALLARALTPAELGAYTVAASTLAFVLVFLGLNANAYVYRAVPGSSRRIGERILLSVATFEVTLAAALMGLFVLSGAADVALALLRLGPYAFALAIALAWYLAEVITQDLLSYLYARQRIGSANVVEVLKQAAPVPVVFALWLATGGLTVDTAIVCSLLGTTVAIAYAAVVTRPWSGAVDLAVVRRAVRFGAPLIVPSVAIYSIKFADRYVLSATRSLDETGLYGLAASMANLLYTFSALVIANTLTPAAIRSNNEGDVRRRDALLWRTLKYSLWLFAVGSVAIYLVGAAFLGGLTRPEYVASLSFFPWIALGYGLIVVAGPAHMTLWLAERTRTIVVIDSLSMATALVLDFLLIPYLGGYGAALATILAFAVAVSLKYARSGIASALPWRDLFAVDSELATARRMLASVRRHD